MLKKSRIVVLLLIWDLCLGADVCEYQLDGTYLAHPADCSKFLLCVQGETYFIESCPDGYHFNRELGICDYKVRAGCDIKYIQYSTEETCCCCTPKSDCSTTESPVTVTDCPTESTTHTIEIQPTTDTIAECTERTTDRQSTTPTTDTEPTSGTTNTELSTHTTDTEPTMHVTDTEPNTETTNSESTTHTTDTEPTTYTTDTEPNTHTTDTEPTTLTTDTEPTSNSTNTEPTTHTTDTEPTTLTTDTEPTTNSTSTEPTTHTTDTESTTLTTDTEPITNSTSTEPTTHTTDTESTSQSIETVPTSNTTSTEATTHTTVSEHTSNATDTEPTSNTTHTEPITVSPTIQTTQDLSPLVAHCENNLTVCINQPDDSKFVYPGNCRKFVTCQWNCAIVQSCPANLYYDITIDVCDYPENVICPYQSDTDLVGPSGRNCDDPGACKGMPEGSLLPDPESNGYIVCQCECESKMDCPPGLIYNHTIHVCDWARPSSNSTQAV